MKEVPRAVVRAKQNYEDRKEKWLLQVTSDHSLTAGDVRTAFAISLHMNRKRLLLAWPGYTTLAKDMGGSRRMAIRGVKALERAGHMRVVRSRNGSKNNPNHYHPNAWANQMTTPGVVTRVTLGSDRRDTGVVTSLSPEPTSEPTKEPTIRDLGSDNKNGGRGSGETVESLGQPKLLWSTPTLTEVSGTPEANLLLRQYAAALGSFRPVISRFERR